MKVINIKRGLDIHLVGTAEKVVVKAPLAQSYALCPAHYQGITPKILVKAGDVVKAGSPLFFDKEHPEVLFCAPISGTVADVVRGDKRKVLAVVVTPDGKNDSEQFDTTPLNTMSAEQAKTLLLNSGMWPMLIQRPFGIIAKSVDTPRDIYISGLDTAPLGIDTSFVMQDQKASFEAGIALLSKLTNGKVHLTVSEDTTAGTLSQISNAQVHTIKGKHPSGNVGTQIAYIKPLAKGDIVWTIDIQHVAMIGKLALTGRVDMEKMVAVAGSEVKKPMYCKIISGAQVESITKNNIKQQEHLRLISGNPLSGSTTCQQGYVGFYHNSISALKQGDYHEFIGWAMPRFGKFSFSHSYFSWLTPNKKYAADTNLNGGARAFVMNGIYEKVMPLDIYPVYLLKAIMCGDIDKMENLGIYEVIEEDFALCEFICPSKIEWQATLREGINKMIKEL